MACTRTLTAAVNLAVVFNSVRFESPTASTSRILANITVSGVPAQGVTLNYLVDGANPNSDMGIQNGAWEINMGGQFSTAVSHTITIVEANAC